MAQNFNYHRLKSPVIGLAPMDGVTDKAYREIQKRYGNPDIMFTEFTNVMGLCKGALPLFRDLDYEEAERPIIAQLFGNDPDYFRHAVKIVLALGFDGVDINMGCPARKVTDKGGGASLIKQPEIARSIIREVRKGIKEYKETHELTGVDPSVEGIVEQYVSGRTLDKQLENFTVSVKTRIGYDSNIVESWIGELNKEDLDWISVHGRTLRQMYTGEVDKEALALAVTTATCPVLVNGNVTDGRTAKELLGSQKLQVS
jgi:tRNA-dihydrouridine synthase